MEPGNHPMRFQPGVTEPAIVDEQFSFLRLRPAGASGTIYLPNFPGLTI